MTDPKQPQSVTEIAQRICEELNLARGDDAILMRELRAFRRALLEDAAFNMWRNSDAPKISHRSLKTARGRDREFALDYLRRLAVEE